MVDTHALGACAERHGGSSPLSPTKRIITYHVHIKLQISYAYLAGASWLVRIYKKNMTPDVAPAFLIDRYSINKLSDQRINQLIRFVI